MPVRQATAYWEGNLKEGKGRMKFGGGAFEGQYSFSSRFEEGPGTNPEELIAAAHAGCFSMAFSNGLAKDGFTPTRVSTTAKLTLEGGVIITIDLVCEAIVPGISEQKFMELGEVARATCPVSKALAGPKISLQAKLLA